MLYNPLTCRWLSFVVFTDSSVVFSNSVFQKMRLLQVDFLILRSCRYLPLSDIFMSSVARDASILIQSEKTTRLFDWVCDVKEAGGDKYYRFDESKCLVWLKRRVQKVETSRQPQELSDEISSSCGNPSSQRTTSRG